MLKKISIKQLLELKQILNKIEYFDYNKPLAVIENSTIGRHTRHVLEFYECLFNSKDDDIICYDDRKRNLILEESVRFACDYIDEIIDAINAFNLNNKIELKAIYDGVEVISETSFHRELTYNIEHTVHHLAIIRIAVVNELKYINLSSNFGFANSTIQFLNTQTTEG